MEDPTLDPEQLENLKEILEGDDEISLDTIINTYLESAEEQIDSINLALEMNDRRTLVETAHSLKGSSSNFGALRLVKISKNIQLQGDEAPPHELKDLTVDLQSEFVQVRDALKQLSQTSS